MDCTGSFVATEANSALSLSCLPHHEPLVLGPLSASVPLFFITLAPFAKISTAWVRHCTVSISIQADHLRPSLPATAASGLPVAFLLSAGSVLSSCAIVESAKQMHRSLWGIDLDFGLPSHGGPLLDL